MKSIKCLVNLGEDGEEKERFIELPDKDTEWALEAELKGELTSMPEFRTTKGEVIAGSQIICKIKRLCNR